MVTWDLFHLKDNFSDFIPFFIKVTEKKMENRSKNSNGNFRYYSLAAWMLRIDPVFLEFTYQITGGPSSSCEMIILRNNSQGGIIRVCMGISTTALRNKKIPHLTSTVYRLLSDRLLWWKEPILAISSFCPKCRMLIWAKEKKTKLK